MLIIRGSLFGIRVCLDELGEPLGHPTETLLIPDVSEEQMLQNASSCFPVLNESNEAIACGLTFAEQPPSKGAA